MMYKLVKSVADAVVGRLARALPAWRRYTVEQTFPARAPYQPMLPRNMGAVPPRLAQHFRSVIPFEPHRLYRLHNVHVTWDGAVFQNLRVFTPSVVQPRFASRFQDTLLLRQWLGKKVVVEAESVAVCHDQWSVENYYHWLVDTLPRLLVLRQSHPNILLMLPQPLPPLEMPDYVVRTATVLGFGQHLPVNTRQTLRAGCVLLPELTAISLTQNPELIRQVRDELVAAMVPTHGLAGRKVYAARSASGVRRIANEAAVDALLEAAGFEKVYFEQLTFLEQVALMSETSVLLGMHGAGMTNMLFLPPGATVIEMLNADYGDPCYFRLASCLGVPYFCVPCAPTHPEQANQSNVAVEVALLRQVLAMAMSGTAQPTPSALPSAESH